MTEKEELLKYLSAMEVIDFNKLGFVYGKETIIETLDLIRKQEIENKKLKQENEKKDKIINIMAEYIGQDIRCIRPEIESLFRKRTTFI